MHVVQKYICNTYSLLKIQTKIKLKAVGLFCSKPKRLNLQGHETSHLDGLKIFSKSQKPFPFCLCWFCSGDRCRRVADDTRCASLSPQTGVFPSPPLNLPSEKKQEMMGSSEENVGSGVEMWQLFLLNDRMHAHKFLYATRKQLLSTVTQQCAASPR